MCEFDKLDNQPMHGRGFSLCSERVFAPNTIQQNKVEAMHLYLIYKRSPSARVCISDKDQLLMFYLSLIKDS